MYDYDTPIRDFHNVKVNLPNAIREKLRKHRKANQDRLIRNIPKGISVNQSSFIKQGSYAIWTSIQEQDNAYDIDDGVAFYRQDLADDDGIDMTPEDAKEMVRKALVDDRFDKKPEIKHNCVRVFYAEGHHVDIPVYRRYTDASETEIQEIAGEAGWKTSDPQQINVWFLERVEELNGQQEDAGGQLRRMIRLFKRFARSRGEKWDMPSGIKLTMLATECFRPDDRDDEAFYNMMSALRSRLLLSLVVENLADQSRPREQLTKTSADPNMIVLRDKTAEALVQLTVLHIPGCTNEKARKAWDWVFQSEGFFDAYDKDAKKAVALFEKEALIRAGVAATNTAVRIGLTGVSNLPHKWYGEK